MNVVDSSGWLEYFADGQNARFFAPAVEDIGNLIVPTISIYEVFKRVMEQRGEGVGLQAIALMQQGHVIDLTSEISLQAAKLSLTFKLPLADSVMLASARGHHAQFWTQDADFKRFSDVKYVSKKKR